jgi:hypothetical protein
MFLGCEMTFLFLPTSEGNIAVLTLVFDNRLWVLFVKVCFSFDMFVVYTLILALKITETAVKCDLLHYFL